jgi:DNA replication protein DnaC
MLDRPKYPPSSDECKYVKLRAGEAPQMAYEAWLATVCAAPRYCELHSQTALILSPEVLGVRPVYDSYGYESVARPNEFEFRALFVCPSCCVKYARCPPEFHQTSFDAFDTSTSQCEATLAKAREFAAQVNARGCGFALFVGLTGAGKTRLACNVVRELKFRDALYVRQGELTCAIRASYGRKDVVLRQKRRDDDDDECDRDDTPPTPLEMVQSVRFLVLDEIGCTALANDERLMIDELLKHRYEHRKPTILISNLPLKGTADAPGFREFLGDALADRIKEATGNGKFIVQFSGQSYRRSTGENYLEGLG